MRRKFLVVVFVAVLLVTLTSCTSYRLPSKEAGLVGNLIEKDYEILGPVTVSGRVHNLFWIFGFGGIGYKDILEEARELYPETDAVINITKDRTSFSLLLIYNNFGYEFTGLAIKYLDTGANTLDVSIAVNE